VKRGLEDDDSDPEARFLSAQVAGLRIFSCYVPNGQEPSSPKFEYKQRWLDRLLAYLARHHQPGEPLLVCGDFNIAPEDRDVYDPEALRDDVLCHPKVRERWSALISWGLVDSYRLHVADAGKFSWWDYRMLAFPKGRGLRIDHVLATGVLAARCSAAAIDRDERKGKQPSDHAPVVAEFSWP
jgi:exodeoxyribonuclease-3